MSEETIAPPPWMPADVWAMLTPLQQALVLRRDREMTAQVERAEREAAEAREEFLQLVDARLDAMIRARREADLRDGPTMGTA